MYIHPECSFPHIRSNASYISYKPPVGSREYSDNPSLPANGFPYRPANSLTGYSGRDDNHPSKVEVSHYRLSKLPEERSGKNSREKPNQTCTFHCRIAFAGLDQEWRWKMLSNTYSNNPYGPDSLMQHHVPMLVRSHPKPYPEIKTKKHSRHRTVSFHFASTVRLHHSRIRPNPVDDR